MLDDRVRVFTESAIVTRSHRLTDAVAGMRRSSLDPRWRCPGKFFSNARRIAGSGPLEPNSGEKMRTARWVVTGVVVVALGSAIVSWVSPNFDEAQANSDRQTVNCLSSHLTQDDKKQIAQFADANDFNSLWRVYDRIFPDCAVRGDQWERKGNLEASAWRLLASDREFTRLREANAALAAAGHP
ncbi:hypothetical protein RI103_01925 [Paraburkholderia sp. FT54]|uniref:hypothetical protein n=1 Tax=Paraburkholderia sp. FT54 TaxID=3074437 RepID=UPI002877AD36|nr:hypothetical protein [Paraburkholderia sp. FT54]WNC90145.1 hypothetical protein RI103_01925 [Paraburkholderia sp. FT54]